MSHNNNINRRIYNTIQLYNIYRTEIPTDTSNLRNWETPHSKRPVITQAHRLGYETMAVCSKRLVVSVVLFFYYDGGCWVVRATLRNWGILPPPVTRTTKGPASDGCGPCGPPGCDARRTRTQCEGVRCPKESHIIVGGLVAGVGKRFGRRFMGKGSTIG